MSKIWQKNLKMRIQYDIIIKIGSVVKMMMFVEEKLKTDVIKKYDIAVCGGGFAGISAGTAAAMTDDFGSLDVSLLQEKLA